MQRKILDWIRLFYYALLIDLAYYKYGALRITTLIALTYWALGSLLWPRFWLNYWRNLKCMEYSDASMFGSPRWFLSHYWAHKRIHLHMPPKCLDHQFIQAGLDLSPIDGVFVSLNSLSSIMHSMMKLANAWDFIAWHGEYPMSNSISWTPEFCMCFNLYVGESRLAHYVWYNFDFMSIKVRA